jgi:hypothetical protein
VDNPSVEEIARRLRCTPEEVRAQLRANAKQLRGMAKKAGKGTINGYTAAELLKNAADFETRATESTADFRARIAAKMGATPLAPKARDISALVRKPTDRGYYPPKRKDTDAETDRRSI